MNYPVVIQGGMGIGVSSWPLANAVSRLGQLGIVSGTVLDVLCARRLQSGDPGGHIRRALNAFPVPELAKRVLDRYFIPGGKAVDQPYKAVPTYTMKAKSVLQELAVAANFVEVWLAKEGHDGLVGVNYMEKLQMPNIPSIYGAMLAGVDFIIMGAGIPREIPGILDRLLNHEAASLRLDVEGASPGDDFRVRFDPKALLGKVLPPLRRPNFLPIIASAALAVSLAKKSNGKVDGFIIEGPTAGGHNAPPRGDLRLDERGEPLYGPRDEVDLSKIKSLGLPFWLAGGYSHPGKLKEALEAGAAGVQIGTAFAFCRESSLADEIKQAVIGKVLDGTVRVFTDTVASPTGFPFKVVQLDGTVSSPEVYGARPRLCDLGYLRQLFKKEDGTVGYRCSAEPIDRYVGKGGALEDTVNRKCLCNGLMANLGFPQRRNSGYVEAPIVTAGDDVIKIKDFIKAGGRRYSAADVVERVLERISRRPEELAAERG